MRKLLFVNCLALFILAHHKRCYPKTKQKHCLYLTVTDRNYTPIRDNFLFKRYFSFFPLLGILILLAIGCDTAPGVNNYMDAEPYVSNFEITPNKVEFDPLMDGQKDTTLAFSLRVNAYDLDDNTSPKYYVFANDEDEPRYLGEFDLLENSTNTYKTTVNIFTTTYTYIKYRILITPGDIETSGGNYI